MTELQLTSGSAEPRKNLHAEYMLQPAHTEH